MFNKKLMVCALASSLALTSSFGQEKASAAVSAKPATPAFDVEKVLAVIPDVLGEYTYGGKVVSVRSTQLKQGLREELKMAAAQGQAITPDMMKRFLPRFAEQLAMDEVLPIYAAQKGFKPNEDQVRKEVAQLKKQGTPEQFKQFLKAQGCADEEAFVKKVAPRQAVQQLVKSLADKLVVDEKMVRAHYDANKAQHDYYECSHILAAFDAKNPRNDKITPAMESAALKKIQDIKAKLDKGESFESLAKSSSDCPSGKEGGVLGSYNPKTKMAPGQMVGEFTDAFNKLKPGEVTASPVKTQFGYHLIKASEVKTRSYEELKPSIESALKQKLMQEKGAELLSTVKAAFKITYHVK